MSLANDARFWDRAAPKYARSAVADQAGYERTLERTRGLLQPDGRVVELGCGTGTTALRLAGDVATYLATDISPNMIAIAGDRHSAAPIAGLAFQTATVETLMSDARPVDAVLAFNYLHLVRDVPATLHGIHALLASDGLFISKTPCVGEMAALIRRVLLPAMRVVGKAPHVTIFGASELGRLIDDAGFEILAVENHASKGNDNRPYIVARKL